MIIDRPTAGELILVPGDIYDTVIQSKTMDSRLNRDSYTWGD